ncbi:major facilitator superfamily domain-containing protein 4A [Brienomyrus brachyistius]|uniref:major facilitator superfamily domain-containing protein 4A n=1 Tax=Brienomyrus brachyistius TaxID=42636 RepID=UPI0020B40B82|nr:major facilitator superfamily domain-containing protein 4A [Brienomyrus brachyistius]
MIVDERILSLFKRNWQHTLTYWSVFFSFGLCIAFLGPTILDLRCQTQSTLQEITWVFFSQQFCLLVGSSIGGVFKKTLFCALSALLLSSLSISLVFAIIPLCHNVLLLAVAMAIAGLAMGVIDTIANIQLVKIYQKDSAIFLQALHFFIGFGALVSPLIADPFLSETNCVVSNDTGNATAMMEHLRNTLAGGPMPNVSQYQLPVEGKVITQVSFAFWIMALINLPVPIAVFMLMFREKLIPCCASGMPPLLDRDELAIETCHESNAKDPDAGGHSDPFCCCQNNSLRGLPSSFFGIHILGGMVLFMTDGIVGAYAGFVYTYAVAPPMSLAHRTAGYLASVFWAAITVGRLVCIPLSYRFQPVRLLLINLAGVIITVLLLLIFYTNSVFLFVGTCLLGLFLSSIFPCMVAFTEDILDYQGCATTVLVTSAGLGEMVLQVLVGSIIHSEGSYSFLLCGMIIGCIGFLLFFGLLFFHRMHKKYLAGNSKKSPMTEEPGLDCVQQ